MTDKTMTDYDQTDEQDDWAACPAGEIQQMVRRERTRRTKRKVAQFSSATAIVAVLVMGVVVGGRHWFDQQTKPPTPSAADQLIAGISCSDVVEHLPAYVNDTLDRESHEIYERVFAHLQKCHKCDTHYKAMRDAQVSQSTGELKAEGVALFTPKSLGAHQP